MPNTKSAERRTRSGARRELKNKSVKSRVKTVEKKFLAAIAQGNKEEAAQALSQTASAYDKAAKGGSVNRSKANRKKSRLALKLAALK